MSVRSARLAFCILCAAALTGCGGVEAIKPIKDLVTVRGTVTFDGEPLAQGIVSFAPKAFPGQSATGKIKDGKFTMETTASARGVVIGKYKVRVVSEAPPDAPTAAEQQIPLSQRKMPEPISLIPQKYTDFESSGLEVEVTPGMDAVEIELEPEPST